MLVPIAAVFVALNLASEFPYSNLAMTTPTVEAKTSSACRAQGLGNLSHRLRSPGERGARLADAPCLGQGGGRLGAADPLLTRLRGARRPARKRLGLQCRILSTKSQISERLRPLSSWRWPTDDKALPT